jgi:hypothetical protein
MIVAARIRRIGIYPAYMIRFIANSWSLLSRPAALYSFLETCRLDKVNPWEWLSDVLVRLNLRSDDTAVSLLPMNWKRKPVV